MIETRLEPKYPVELVVEGRRHFYKVGDEMFPGVTGVLDIIGGGKTHGLKKWATNVALANVEKELLSLGHELVVVDPPLVKEIIEKARKRPAEVLDEAADYGTAAHEAFDKIVKGEPLGDLPDEIENSVLAFRDWFQVSGIQMVMGDTPVASKTHRFGGKLDGVGLRGGDWGIVDFKTSKSIHDEMALQVGAYGLAFQETYGPKPSWGLIVRFGKQTPDYEVTFVRDMEWSARAFLAAKELQDAIRIPQFLGTK